MDAPVSFGPMVRQHIMAGVYGKKKLLPSWWLGSTREKKG
jgi:hypothetical protein